MAVSLTLVHGVKVYCGGAGGGVTRLNTQEAGELPFTHSSDPGQMDEVYLLLEFPEKFTLRTSRLPSAGLLSFSRNASESPKGSRGHGGHEERKDKLPRLQAQ